MKFLSNLALLTVSTTAIQLEAEKMSSRQKMRLLMKGPGSDATDSDKAVWALGVSDFLIKIAGSHESGKIMTPKEREKAVKYLKRFFCKTTDLLQLEDDEDAKK